MFVYRHRTTAEIKVVEGLIRSGLSDRDIARRTGIRRSTVQRWRTQGPPRRGRSDSLSDWRPFSPGSYSYLLGIYLGDGYVSKALESPVLEISLDARHPGIAVECTRAIWQAARVQARSSRRGSGNSRSIRITAGSHIWPHAFPQHGPGKKHQRAIELADWQQAIASRHPKQFVRGLIHSDGSRCVNRFSIQAADGIHEYAYARYFFTNLSADIRALFCDSCDRLGIRWTQSSHKNISIASRDSVQLLDSFVGPKR